MSIEIDLEQEFWALVDFVDEETSTYPDVESIPVDEFNAASVTLDCLKKRGYDPNKVPSLSDLIEMVSLYSTALRYISKEESLNKSATP